MQDLVKRNDGSFSLYDVISVEDINVLSPGYIITLEGNIIAAKTSEDHGAQFSRYLDYYFNRNVSKYYEIMKACIELTNINHVVYLGVRTEDVKNIYAENGNSMGYGLLLLPVNYKEKMTEQQKNICLKLLLTNKSIFGDYKKMDLQVYQIDNQDELNYDDFLNFLEMNKKK